MVAKRRQRHLPQAPSLSHLLSTFGTYLQLITVHFEFGDESQRYPQFSQTPPKPPTKHLSPTFGLVAGQGAGGFVPWGIIHWLEQYRSVFGQESYGSEHFWAATLQKPVLSQLKVKLCVPL